MKKATAKIIDDEPATDNSITDPRPGSDISWEHAKELYDTAEDFARRSGEKLIDLSRVLATLKAEFFDQGGGCKYGSGTPARTEASSVDNPFPRTTAGWQEIVRQRLGISARTANRLIERGTKLELIQGLAAGESVIYDDTTGTDKTLEPTQEIQRLAQAAWADVINGTVSAPRAWAGIVGESTRRDDQGGAKQRAAVDHAAVMVRAIRSLRAGLKILDQLKVHDRHKVDLAWADMVEDLPPRWISEIRKGGK